tara:strand:+ start:2028 stop:2984 length:957 start_codon:yes stop_codon:yes gene_type:complete
MQLDNLRPKRNKTSLFMQEPFFSNLKTFKNYEGYFIPICSNEQKKTSYFTVDKNKSNLFCFHETENVSSLLVENLSLNPLLILNGEVFDGAMQDRVANESVLIPSKSSVEINVSCVEQGRWSYKTKAFRRGKNMFNYHSKGVKDLHNNSLKHNQPSGSIQSNVWSSISNKQRRMGVFSKTSSINDTYQKYEESLKHLREKIFETDNQVGLLVMIPGKYIGIDLFSNEDVFKQYKERLYNSHLIELIENIRNDRKDFRKQIDSFMLELMYSKEVYASKKLGEEYTIYNSLSQLSSTCLALNNDLVHLTAMKNIENGHAR